MKKFSTEITALMCVHINDDANAFDNALLSIHRQTMMPKALLLICDGSINNNQEDIIRKYKYLFEKDNILLEIFRLNRCMGHGYARAKGVELVNTKIIAICDSDDINLPTRFEEEYNILKFTKVNIVGGQIREITEKNLVRKMPLKDQDIKKLLKYRCPMNQMSVMFYKNDIIKVLNYETFYNNEDYLLWIKCALNGYQFYNIDKVLVLASINKNFYKNRTGIKYFISSYKIQKILYMQAITKKYEFIINILALFILQILTPKILLKLIYNSLLRK